VARAAGRAPTPPPVSATEVPLLYEVGGQERFDAVVVVTAPASVRAAPERGRRRGSASRACCPDSVKVAQADFVLRQRRLARRARRFVA
jgi:dephospho-CoA kinase